jgi:hypothetical protein
VERPPVDPDQLDRELTELERLSQSASGMRFGSQFYDSKSDNPLEPVSVTLRALDKITAQYTDIVIEMGETSEFGTLEITARTCDKRPPEEVPEVTAFLQVASLDQDEELVEQQTDAVEGEDAAEPVEAEDAPALDAEEEVTDEETSVDLDELIFSGWMFASSPALNALEHPVYDVWVIDCKMVDPAAG